MKKSVIILGAVLLVIVTSLATFTVTVNQLKLQGSDPSNAASVGDKLGEIGAYLDQYAVDEMNPVTLGDAAADAMISATGDPWSYYIPAEEYEAYTEHMQNAYVGIGITLLQEADGSYVVESVQQGSPAAEAGIQPDDRILAVDGQSTENMPMAELVNLVRGEAGTAVELTLQHRDTKVNVLLQRTTIVNRIVTSRLTAGHTGYIRIESFSEHVAEQTIAAIDSVIADGAERIVFDVRCNPGGYLTELIEILDHILPEGTLFKMVSSAGEEKLYTSDARCISMPMAVLVDRNSYSAAEFFAAALQEYEWATVVGEKTTGKGKYQSVFTLTDGSAINISIGKYFTPSGKSLSDDGITPDVGISLSEAQLAAFYAGELPAEADPQFLAAVASFLHSGK